MNGDSASNYSQTAIRGSGSAATSFRFSGSLIYLDYYGPTLNSASSTYIVQLNSYSNTTTNKPVLVRTNAAISSGTGVEAHVGMWRNTAAITSLTIGPTGGNIFSGSTFTLYGILKA
jgi:hypothetical protein